MGSQATAVPKPPTDPAAKRRRTLLHWGVTVAVATVGIVLLAAVVPILREQQQPPVGTTTITPEQQSVALLAQAEDALSAGETTAALAFARSAMAADPSNPTARELVDRLSANSPEPAKPTDTPNTGPKPSTEPSVVAGDVGYLQPVPDLAGLLPAALEGYTLGSPVITKDSVSISASPMQAGATAGMLIWTVRDMKSVKQARAFVRKTTKVLYGKQRATVTVHGVPAYYGTDGERIATVTYTRGRYAFEVLLAVEPGRAVGANAAAAFRDTPVQ